MKLFILLIFFSVSANALTLKQCNVKELISLRVGYKTQIDNTNLTGDKAKRVIKALSKETKIKSEKDPFGNVTYYSLVYKRLMDIDMIKNECDEWVERKTHLETKCFMLPDKSKAQCKTYCLFNSYPYGDCDY